VIDHGFVAACGEVANLQNVVDEESGLSEGGRWLANSDMTQVEAAKILGVTQARVSDIKRGKINQFSMDLLVRLVARAGLHPKLRLAA
jgi:predicted XRE-type DNA-binding protein